MSIDKEITGSGGQLPAEHSGSRLDAPTTGAADDPLVWSEDPYASDLDPQQISDEYDRGGDMDYLTFSQYLTWRTGPGIRASVLEAAAAKHDDMVTFFADLDERDADADCL